MISRACCRHRLVDKARAGYVSAQEASATLRTACTVVQSITRTSRKQLRELMTASTSVPAERAKGAGKGEGNGIAGLAASEPYVLPAPTWSLSDLNLNVATSDEEAVDSAKAALSPEEVCTAGKPQSALCMKQEQFKTAEVCSLLLQRARLLGRSLLPFSADTSEISHPLQCRRKLLLFMSRHVLDSTAKAEVI